MHDPVALSGRPLCPSPNTSAIRCLQLLPLPLTQSKTVISLIVLLLLEQSATIGHLTRLAAGNNSSTSYWVESRVEADKVVGLVKLVLWLLSTVYI
jgi:hypothetical protein